MNGQRKAGFLAAAGSRTARTAKKRPMFPVAD
jgi:hypothetical protein